MKRQAPTSRSRIQLLFLGLAALTLLVFGLSFELFHHLASRHEAALILNRENAEELGRFHRLEEIEVQADAPGNDIFVSGNVPKERQRLAGASTAFRNEAGALRRQLVSTGRLQSVERLDLALQAAAVMEQDSYRAIDAFSREDLAIAAHAMAEMDQAHTRAVGHLHGAVDAIRARESLAFKTQEAEFARVEKQEKVVGFGLVLLTAAIVFYGRRAARQMIGAAEASATFVAELQEREKELETAVRERDHQTRSLEQAQSIAGLGSWELELTDNSVHWSRELYRIFGAPAESAGVPYGTSLQLVHDDDRQSVDDAIRTSIETHAPFQIEHRAVRADGSTIVLSTRGTVECDASGIVVRIIGIAHDISAQRTSEAELQRSEERFQLAARATNDVIWDWDPVTDTLWVSEGWASHFGHTEGPLNMQVWTDAIHPEDLERVMKSFRETLDGGESSWLDEYRIRSGSGEVRCVLDRGFIVRNAAGKPIRMIGAMMDITGRKDAETSIALLHRKTELILESAADGLFGIDRDGIATFVNRAAARILGYEPDELIGRRIHEVIQPKYEDGTDFPWVESEPFRTLDDGLRRDESSVFRTRSGKSVPVDVTSSAMLDDVGDVTGAVLTFRDISERREVDRLKSEFVSTVSHELRTPLTSIRGALGLLSTGRLGTLPEKAARLVEIASTNTDRLVRLINDILDIERMESGRVMLSRVAADGGDLVRQAVDIVRQLADQAGITIVVKTRPAALVADRDRIVQTLTNLIGNAVKFSPARSTITVSVEEKNGDVVFRVADEGRGIPADKLDVVFERFKQVDASDSRDKGGSGLGLAICRSVVRQHGGEIFVSSVVGRGTQFSFVIPAVAAGPEAGVSFQEVIAGRFDLLSDELRQVKS